MDFIGQGKASGEISAKEWSDFIDVWREHRGFGIYNIMSKTVQGGVSNNPVEQWYEWSD